MEPTYYEELEVPETASHQEVASAYRRLAKEYHPDRLVGMPDHLNKLRLDAEERWRKIEEAWSVIRNPEKRRQYDAGLKNLRDGGAAQDASNQYDPSASSNSQSPPPPNPSQTAWRTPTAGNAAAPHVGRRIISITLNAGVGFIIVVAAWLMLKDHLTVTGHHFWPSLSASVAFYRSDDLPTLIKKAHGLIKDNDSDEARRLVRFLETISRGDGKTPSVVLQPAGVDSSGALTSQAHPCDIGGMRHANCIDGMTIYVEGDVKDISDSPGGGAIVTSKDDRCYTISPSELATLRTRQQQIEALLGSLGNQFGTKPVLAGGRSKACEPVILAVNKYAGENDRATKQREAEEKALAATVRADDFEARLQTAFRNRAVMLGIDPQRYAASVKAVVDIVRLCSSISEADFAKSFDNFGRPLLAVYASGEYEMCRRTLSYRPAPDDGVHMLPMIPPVSDAPTLLVGHDLQEHWEPREKIWGPIKLSIKVYVNPIANVPVIGSNSNIRLADFTAKYLVIAADIENPNAVGPLGVRADLTATASPHEPEFRPLAESVCQREVMVYSSPPLSYSQNENRSNGIRPVGPIYPSEGQVRIIETKEQATHIELEVRGHRWDGWVMRGSVRASCSNSEEDR